MIRVPLHVILESAAIFIGFRYFLYLRRKQSDSIHSSNRLWIIIGAIFGAVFGSRLIGGLENPERLAAAHNVFLHFYQNSTVVGGLLGGLTGVEIMKKVIGEKHSSGDLFTYPLILAIIIGRIGCFSMGVYEDTFGVVTSSVFGLNLGDGLLRHPVTLYEIVFLVVLWLTLSRAEKMYSLAAGGRFKLFMIAYLCFRLLLDFIKPHYTYSFGLSTIQIACTAGLIYYSYFLFRFQKNFFNYA
jgi:prolipoprotein diacylglyceryltransferase